MKKIFLQAELEFFEQASFDRNPLHRDSSYARKTQFGQRVVYGIYAALFGLGEWLDGRNIKLTRIKGVFNKPLLLDTAYDLEFLEQGNTTDITYSSRDTIFLKLRIWQPSSVEHPFTWPDPPAFTPRMSAAENIRYGPDGKLYIPGASYHCGWTDALNAPPSFRLRRNQFPFNQMMSFLWSTYFVGMELPGRQALYTSFEFHFDSQDSSADGFQLEPARVSMDRRFNLVNIKGAATGVREYSLSAFERPRSVETPLATTQETIGLGESMAGKRVLITGGSRGFGAVLAQAFALQGAQVIVNFHQSRAEAEELARNIESIGARPILIQGDASQSKVWETFKSEVQAIDILINNASPVIPAIRFKDQNTADIISFVDRSLALFLEPCAQIIPRMNAGGTVIQVSSVFVAKPEAGFSHYTAAKSAAEAVMRSLATEHGSLRFLIFRAPKMLTDQTNTVTASANMSSAVEVAKTLLTRLSQFTTVENIGIVDG